MMLGKRTQPMIGKISELLVSGNRATFLDVVTSPKSPLELKIQSPRGVKNFDLGSGVGLGIVAALDKSGGGGGSGDVSGSEILARYAMSSPRPIRAVPIPVINNVKNCCYRACYEEPPAEMHQASFESSSYSSYMTCHGQKKESFSTRTRGEHGRKSKNVSIFSVSPARCPEDTIAFPVSDFLSSCNLCRKKLHGKDIYMYRGEKAFCSTECRERQIIIDDRKEQCRSEATRSSVDVSSSSPYAQGNIYSTGILAI